MCLGNFVASIDLTIVTVALPTLSRNLNADNGELQWIVDAYALTTAGLLLSAGNLGDRYGRRGWLTIGLAIFAATSAVAATATSPGTLIAARAAMGLGAAIIYPTTLALITNIFPAPAQRAKAIGVWSAMTGLGVIAGPITGGWLLGHFSLGSIFLGQRPHRRPGSGRGAAIRAHIERPRAGADRLRWTGIVRDWHNATDLHDYRSA